MDILIIYYSADLLLAISCSSSVKSTTSIGSSLSLVLLEEKNLSRNWSWYRTRSGHFWESLEKTPYTWCIPSPSWILWTLFFRSEEFSVPFGHQVFCKFFPNFGFNSTKSTLFPFFLGQRSFGLVSELKLASTTFTLTSCLDHTFGCNISRICTGQLSFRIWCYQAWQRQWCTWLLHRTIDAATCRMAGGCELQVVALFLGGFGLGRLDGSVDILKFSFIWNWKQSVEFETFIYAVYFDWLGRDVTSSQ